MRTRQLHVASVRTTTTSPRSARRIHVFIKTPISTRSATAKRASSPARPVCRGSRCAQGRFATSGSVRGARTSSFTGACFNLLSRLGLTVRVSTDIDEEAAAFSAKYGKPNEPERHTILMFELYDDDGDRLYKSYVEPWARADLNQAGHRYTYEVLSPHVVDFVDEAIIMNKRAAHALRTRAEPDLDSALSDRFVWRRRRGPPTRGVPRGLINAHEWEENRRNAELGAEHISDERRMKRARRDPDPWRNASDADAHAYKLAEEANRTRFHSRLTRYRALFARNAKAAAEAFEVAADAWEEVGDYGDKVEIRKEQARHFYIESFLAMHPHLSSGYYLISDVEARHLAARIRSRPPRGTADFLRVPLTHVGPVIELHRLKLFTRELSEFKRKRPWAYAIARVR